MTTESTSVPSPSGRGQSAGQAVRGISIALPRETHRDTTDRVALPPRRPAGAPLRFGLPLILADWLAALAGTVVLSGGQRDAFLIVQLVVFVTVLNAHAGLYRSRVAQAALDQLPVLAARITVSWLAAATALAAFLPAPAMSLGVLLAGATVQLAVACSCRSLVHLRRRALARSRRRSALVVGTGAAARRMAAILSHHPEYGLRPVGIAAPAAAGADREQVRGSGDGSKDGGGDAPALPVLTTTEEIHRAVIQNGVQEAVFIDSRSTDRSALVALFHEYGCTTWFVGGERDTAPGQPGAAAGHADMAEHLWGFPCRRLGPPAAHHRGRAAKRVLDMVIAGPVLIALSPVLLACALAVRLCDGPGVLFHQERIGQNGRPFTLLKFRTLRPADEHEAATRWSVANDHRMSPVGSVLRRTSMDELPQLWNVLRGDMSLVGPRPERPFFVANFSKTHPGYAARHRMPVGITGLAQVHGLRGDTSIEDRSRFDNHYIDHWSLWQDVCILLRTAASLVRPAGS